MLYIVSSSSVGSAGCHSHRTIQADGLTIEHGMGNDVLCERGEFLGYTQTTWVRNIRRQRGANFFWQASQNWGIKQSWGNRGDTNMFAGQITGRHERHPNNAGFG